MTFLEGLLGGAVGGFAVLACRRLRSSLGARRLRREALRAARAHGRMAGRVMCEQGCARPNAWPSRDAALNEFNRGAAEGWVEADRRLRAEARRVVEGAERILRGAA